MKQATLSNTLAALLLCSGGIAWGQEAAPPAAAGREGVTRPAGQGRPGVTRPADKDGHHANDGHDHGPQGVSPAGGAGGGRSAAPS